MAEYFSRDNLSVDRIEGQRTDLDINYNIGPTRTAPEYHLEKRNDVIVHIVQYLQWGFIPFWTKNPKDLQPWRRFNARVESLREGTSLWRNSKNKKRCVVPMQGYFEWLHKPVGKSGSKVDKIPYYIKRKDDKLMYLAGLRDSVKYEDSDEVVHSFTIVTGPAPKQLKWLHERMPIVLIPGTKEFDTWLDPNLENWNDQLAVCLRGYENDDLEWYEVGKEVNKFTSSGSSLIKPFKDTQAGIMNFVKGSSMKQEQNHLEKYLEQEDQIKQEVVKHEDDIKEEDQVKREEQNMKYEERKIKQESKDTLVNNNSNDTPTKKQQYQYKSRKSESPKKRSITDLLSSSKKRKTSF